MLPTLSCVACKGCIKLALTSLALSPLTLIRPQVGYRDKARHIKMKPKQAKIPQKTIV